MTVAFKTFGCRLNRAEALDLEARYAAAGHEIVPLEGPVPVPKGPVPISEGTVPVPKGSVPISEGPVPGPDLIVVRGCSVTAKAQRDCEKEIERLRHRFPRARILVAGCLPKTGTVPPAAMGTDPSELALEMGTVPPTMGTVPPAAMGTVPVPTATSRAYLKIQDGCSGKCAFCIVPKFRGKPVSVPFADVLARAQAFLDAGYRELVVTGCNLALYRSEGRGLADVLSALAGMGTVPGDMGTDPGEMGTGPRHRVRLGSLEPGICDGAVLDAFAAHPNICRFIHLSLQSGSDAVLRRMNRPYTAETVARFCDAARRRLGPQLALGADVIAGFPGETESDHARTKAFLDELAFTNLHVFPYSERPGTPAATMDGALPVDVRRARAKDLERDGRARHDAFAAGFLGRSVEVCVEKDGLHGWTAEYLPCQLKGPAKRRSLVPVVVDRVADGTLFARG